MAEGKYGKYIITNPKPIETGDMAHHANQSNEAMKIVEFISKDIVPGATVEVAAARTVGYPDPQPFIEAHKHGATELIFFIACSKDEDLGVDVELSLGDEGEKHTFNHTTVVYVPGGMTHCPIYYKNFQKDKHFYLMHCLLKPNYD